MEVSNSEEDFKIFYQPQSPKPSSATFSQLPSTKVSSVQETSNILDAMVLQRKPKTILLELLESQVRGSVPEVAVQT